MPPSLSPRSAARMHRGTSGGGGSGARRRGAGGHCLPGVPACAAPPLKLLLMGRVGGTVDAAGRGAAAARPPPLAEAAPLGGLMKLRVAAPWASRGVGGCRAWGRKEGRCNAVKGWSLSSPVLWVGGCGGGAADKTQAAAWRGRQAHLRAAHVALCHAPGAEGHPVHSLSCGSAAAALLGSSSTTSNSSK